MNVQCQLTVAGNPQAESLRHLLFPLLISSNHFRTQDSVSCEERPGH